MDSVKKVVLVPWDFTEGSNNALLHAIQLASAAENEIMLLHILPRTLIYQFFNSKGSVKEIHDARKKLETVVEDIYSKYNFRPQTLVLEGHPRKLVKDLITTGDLDINLIVSSKIYNYGKKSYQAPNFLKNMVIKNFNVPFIIIDGAPAHSHYIEIVVPLDHDRKYKETVHWIIYLSKYYKCNINLIKPFIYDEGKKKHMANNIYFTKKMLDGNKIIYGIKTAKKKSDFQEEVFKFAQNIDSDLILIMADKYDVYVQNSKPGTRTVPVMCVNPRTRKYQSFY
jgi:hypothetical protein